MSCPNCSTDVCPQCGEPYTGRAGNGRMELAGLYLDRVAFDNWRNGNPCPPSVVDGDHATGIDIPIFIRHRQKPDAVTFATLPCCSGHQYSDGITLHATDCERSTP